METLIKQLEELYGVEILKGDRNFACHLTDKKKGEKVAIFFGVTREQAAQRAGEFAFTDTPLKQTAEPPKERKSEDAPKDRRKKADAEGTPPVEESESRDR